MASDFKGYIDDVKFNVRAGVVIKYKDILAKSPLNSLIGSKIVPL